MRYKEPHRLSQEGGQVGWLPGGHKVSVDNDLFILIYRPGILHLPGD